MGDRGQVLIKDTGVYLYTHWGAYELIDDVKTALQKHWRWDDPEYLARIIFDVLTKENHEEETGFGIDTKKHDDIWRLIVVDCEHNIIELIDNNKPIFNLTFDAFVNADIKALIKGEE